LPSLLLEVPKFNPDGIVILPVEALIVALFAAVLGTAP
jgi:hypothetical protein